MTFRRFPTFCSTVHAQCLIMLCMLLGQQLWSRSSREETEAQRWWWWLVWFFHGVLGFTQTIGFRSGFWCPQLFFGDNLLLSSSSWKIKDLKSPWILQQIITMNWPVIAHCCVHCSKAFRISTEDPSLMISWTPNGEEQTNWECCTFFAAAVFCYYFRGHEKNQHAIYARRKQK